MSPLSDEQKERYSRQIVLPDFGEEGQERLRTSKVLIVGAGGLGSSCALYLASAGVGTLGIADSDCVSLSDLNRQILYSTGELGNQKTNSARQRLAALNPDVNIVSFSEKIDEDNAAKIIGDYEVAVDCTDNASARYLINDTCVRLGIPFVHAAVMQYEGEILTVIPGKSPCYRCVYPEAPPPQVAPEGRIAGILGVVAGTVGTIEASEVIKLILRQGSPLTGLFVYDFLSMNFRNLKLSRRKDCTACGKGSELIREK